MKCESGNLFKWQGSPSLVVWATRRKAVLKLPSSTIHRGTSVVHQYMHLLKDAHNHDFERSYPIHYRSGKKQDHHIVLSGYAQRRCSARGLNVRRGRPKRPCPSSCNIRGGSLVTGTTTVLRSTFVVGALHFRIRAAPEFSQKQAAILEELIHE